MPAETWKDFIDLLCLTVETSERGHDGALCHKWTEYTVGTARGTPGPGAVKMRPAWSTSQYHVYALATHGGYSALLVEGLRFRDPTAAPERAVQSHQDH